MDQIELYALLPTLKISTGTKSTLYSNPILLKNRCVFKSGAPFVRKNKTNHSNVLTVLLMVRKILTLILFGIFSGSSI